MMLIFQLKIVPQRVNCEQKDSMRIIIINNNNEPPADHL